MPTVANARPLRAGDARWTEEYTGSGSDAGTAEHERASECGGFKKNWHPGLPRDASRLLHSCSCCLGSADTVGGTPDRCARKYSKGSQYNSSAAKNRLHARLEWLACNRPGTIKIERGRDCNMRPARRQAPSICHRYSVRQKSHARHQRRVQVPVFAMRLTALQCTPRVRLKATRMRGGANRNIDSPRNPSGRVAIVPGAGRDRRLRPCRARSLGR